VSSTTQLTTFLDLYTDLQNRVRVATGQTTTQTQAQRYINIALQDIALGFDYKMPWLERHAFIQARGPYTTGTITISQGSTSLVGASTLWNTADAFGVKNALDTGKLTIAGGLEVYEVAYAGVTSDTAITLKSPYTVSGGQAAASYIYFDDEYALASDFLRPIDYQIFAPALNINLIGRNEFRNRYPRRNIQGRPRVCCIIDDAFRGNTTPVRRVVFYPYPDTWYTIPYAYISSNLAVTSTGTEQAQLVNDTDEPKMPLRYRHCIVFHALNHWYRDKKDDARADAAKAEYTDIMLRIAADQEIGAPTHARLQPRTGAYTGVARHPYLRRGGRTVSINNTFDRFES